MLFRLTVLALAALSPTTALVAHGGVYRAPTAARAATGPQMMLGGAGAAQIARKRIHLRGMQHW